MTSPTQLQYLKAMGIPVWVSRELIVEEVSDTISNQEVLVKEEPTLTSPQESVSSAISLIDTLDNPKPPSQVLETRSPISSTDITREEKASQSGDNFYKNANQVSNEIGRTSLHTLYGSGNLNADWMVIGQSPDVNESSMQQPYPYETGDLLNNMLRAVGIDQPRTESYWLNVLKSTKRVDNKDELDVAVKLNQLLNNKIKEVAPKVVLIVGQLAAQNLLKSKDPLARLRLKQKEASQSLELDSIPVVVTYYPSYLLSKPQDKAKTWKDLKLAMSLLKE